MRHIRQNKKQDGMSLIELMVAVTIGLIIMLAVVSLGTGTFFTNATQTRYIQLNSDLRIAAQTIARDIRRSGYVSYAARLGGTSTTSTNINLTDGCTSLNSTTALNAMYYVEDVTSSNTTPTPLIYVFNRIDVSGAGTIGTTTEATLGTGTIQNLTNPRYTNVTELTICRNAIPANPAISFNGTFTPSANVNRAWISNTCYEWPIYYIQIRGSHTNTAGNVSITSTAAEYAIPKNPSINSTITAASSCI